MARGPVQSQNTKVELAVNATCHSGITSYGKLMLGDKALEYYNERNVADYIQIPWDNIYYIAASVYFNRWINRFAVFTDANGAYFSFSAKDNKEVLRVCRDHLGANKLRRSATFLQNLGRGFRAVFGKKKAGV
jgi:hypothetical protein